MPAESTSSVYSCADSGFYSASECSTPPTPSLYTRGHFRFPSSASSLSSSPPTHEIVDAPNASGKLPKLTEEPVEQEYHYSPEDPHHCSCRSYQDYHVVAESHTCLGDTGTGHGSNCEITRAYEFHDEYFLSVDAEIRMAKRRRSLESSANSITNKIERRFPSLSRKVKERKRASSSFTRISRSETPSRVPCPVHSIFVNHQLHPSCPVFRHLSTVFSGPYPNPQYGATQRKHITFGARCCKIPSHRHRHRPKGD